MYAYKSPAQRIRVTRRQHDVVDVPDPTKLNHHWSLFATPTDGIGGGYADTTETECLNGSAEEHSSFVPWMPRYCPYNSGHIPTLLFLSRPFINSIFVCASSLFPCFITFHMLTVRLSQPRLFSSKRGGARRYAPFRPRSGKIIWTVTHFCLPQQSHSSASVRRTPVRIFP